MRAVLARADLEAERVPDQAREELVGLEALDLAVEERARSKLRRPPAAPRRRRRCRAASARPGSRRCPARGRRPAAAAPRALPAPAAFRGRGSRRGSSRSTALRSAPCSPSRFSCFRCQRRRAAHGLRAPAEPRPQLPPPSRLPEPRAACVAWRMDRRELVAPLPRGRGSAPADPRSRRPRPTGMRLHPDLGESALQLDPSVVVAIDAEAGDGGGRREHQRVVPGRHHQRCPLRHPDGRRRRHHGKQRALDALGPQQPAEHGPGLAVLASAAPRAARRGA